MFKHSRSAHVRRPQPGVSPAGLFRSEPAPSMRYLRFALFAFFGLLVAIFGLAWFKDSSWSAEGALLIETAPADVQPLLETPKRWLEWMPWSDPSEEGFVASCSGPESGPGAKMSWKSATRHGELAILGVSPAEGVRYSLSLDDVPGEGEIRLEPYGSQTRVRWRYAGDFGGNLFARYFVGFMQRALVPTLQRGLAQLREKALAAPAGSTPAKDPPAKSEPR
jgi:hypothetical protein